MSSTDSPDSPELNPAPEAVEAVADTPPARKTRAAPRRTPRKTAAASTEEGTAPESGEAVAPPRLKRWLLCRLNLKRKAPRVQTPAWQSRRGEPAD
jgi:hypothetical protein